MLYRPPVTESGITREKEERLLHPPFLPLLPPSSVR